MYYMDLIVIYWDARLINATIAVQEIDIEIDIKHNFVRMLMFVEINKGIDENVDNETWNS